MLKLSSKSGIARANQEKVFNYLSDFRNFMHLIPAEKIDDIEVTSETMRFSLPGLGVVGLKIADKQPFSKMIINAMEDSAADFTFRVHVSPDGNDTSRLSLDLDANLNMFVEMMAKNPLQQFLDLMIDKVETIDFSSPSY